MNIILKFRNDIEQKIPYQNRLESYLKKALNIDVGYRIDRLYPSLSTEQLQELMIPASSSSFHDGEEQPDTVIPDLLRYFVIRIPNEKQSKFVLETCRKALGDLLEQAYAQSAPALASPIQPGDDPQFPSQFYTSAAPYGVDAEYAWSVQGGDGRHTQFVSVEGGWRLDHPDLISDWEPSVPPPLTGENYLSHPENSSYLDQVKHGTSALGVIAARDNTTGLVGIAPTSYAMVSSVWSHIDAKSASTTYDVAHAILSAVAALQPGDVITLGVQNDKNRWPIEYRDSIVFDAILTATNKGITVIEPAGDGRVDLDTLPFKRTAIGQSDSGAVIVGAGGYVQNNRGAWMRGMSCYGTAVDCFASGEATVSLGSNLGLPGIPSRTYLFNATSQASAIVAGTVLCIQGVAKGLFGRPLKPQHVRDLLRSTDLNTPTVNGASDRIGCMPNLRAIIDVLQLEADMHRRIFSMMHRLYSPIWSYKKWTAQPGKPVPPRPTDEALALVMAEIVASLDIPEKEQETIRKILLRNREGGF